jgi:hypothetical protein
MARPRVRVSAASPRRSWRSTCRSEREWSGGCFFFFFNLCLTPRTSLSYHSTTIPLLSGLGLSKGQPRRRLAKRKFRGGWGGVFINARLLYKYPIVLVQNEPHTPRTGVNVVKERHHSSRVQLIKNHPTESYSEAARPFGWFLVLSTATYDVSPFLLRLGTAASPRPVCSDGCASPHCPPLDQHRNSTKHP